MKKRCEIQGGGQEMAVMVITTILVNFVPRPNSTKFTGIFNIKIFTITITAISWPSPWISHLFRHSLFEGCTLFLQLGCFGPEINFHLKSEVSITLRCRLCSTCYTAFQFKNCLKSSSAIPAYQKKEMVPPALVISIIV